MDLIWYTIQLVIGYNLILPFALYVLFRLLKMIKRNSIAQTTHGQDLDYAIIVTAYQEIAHIPLTVKSIQELDYQNFLCYVVLDNCDDISSLQFDDERIVLLKPDQVLAGNVRSHFYAIHHFRRAHSHITIIDSDNIVDPAYLKELNKYFAQGFKAVQGIREAQNLNTTYAALDAARDIYYHFYDGLVLSGLGVSATLAGSGMAFEFELYNSCLADKDVSGAGFDKVLQYEIVKRNERIAYTDTAIVYDQKTAKADQLVNQRARWINTWFKYFRYGFDLLIKGVKNFSANQFLFGLILLRPPLFMFLLLSVAFALINIFINPVLAVVWLTGLLVFVSGFAIALSFYKADRRIIKALVNIPGFIFYQLISLWHSRNANQRSVATKHFD